MFPEFIIHGWTVPTYFLIISLDFCLLFFLVKGRATRYGLPVEMALDASMIGVVMGLLGARLFHVFYEAPDFYFKNPNLIFKIWIGGFVVLPGLILGILSGALWLRIKRQNLVVWLDAFAPLFAIGYVLGRWACFFQGCCYGKHTDQVWGLVFSVPQSMGDLVPRIPTQLLTSFIEGLILLVILVWEERLFRRKNPDQVGQGHLFILWLVGHSLNRMVMEILRDDDRGPLLGAMGISFWMALFIFISGLGTIGYSYFRRRFRSEMGPR